MMGVMKHLVWMFEEAWLYGTKRYMYFLHKNFTCIVNLLMLVQRQKRLEALLEPLPSGSGKSIAVIKRCHSLLQSN